MSRSRVHPLSLSAFALLAAVLFARRVWADDAKSLFEEALQASRRGDAANACALFERSFALEAASGTLLNVAACREARDEPASAYNAFAEVFARSEREMKLDRVNVARLRMAALESKVARILVRSADPPSPQRKVFLDGREASTITERALAVDAGAHTVEVREANKVIYSIVVTVALGDLAETTLPALEPPEAPLSRSQATRVAMAPPTSGTGRFQRTAGTIAAGLTVVAIGVGSLAGVVAFKRKDRSDALLATHPALARELSEQGKTYADVSTVSFVVAGAAVTAALTLLMTAPTPRRVEVGAAVGRENALLVRGRF